MDLPDLKELNKLITLCRKRGVDYIKVGELEVQLQGTPTTLKAVSKKRKAKILADVQGDIESDSLSDDQLLFYSVLDPSQEPKSGET